MAKTYSTMSMEELEAEIQDRQEQRDKLRTEMLQLHEHLDERVREFVGEHSVGNVQAVGRDTENEDN